MAETPSCSLLKIAQEAGVAASTASLALRGSSRVKAATKARVTAVAERLGYRPDPRVGTLMARIRGARPVKDREQLAFVWVSVSREETCSSEFLRAIYASAGRRAARLGCAFQEFWLHDGGMTPPRLEKILRTRGITGVVFSAAMHDLQVRLEWNWEHFSAAIIGNTDWFPALHRAGHHHYRSMWTALGKLREAGSRRPAVILHEKHHRRIHGVHQAAFLANHPQPAGAREMTRFGLPAKAAALRAWLKRIRADALIFVVRPPEAILADLRAAPGLRWLVTLASPDESLPGIDLRDDLIAAGAVDLVVSQLHRNERGVPAHPATVLFEGDWHGMGETPVQGKVAGARDLRG